MSAPNTDVSRQAKKHWVPLVGIAAVLVFVGVILVSWLVWEGGQAQQSDVQGVPAATEPAATQPAGPDASANPAATP